MMRLFKLTQTLRRHLQRATLLAAATISLHAQISNLSLLAGVPAGVDLAFHSPSPNTPVSSSADSSSNLASFEAPGEMDLAAGSSAVVRPTPAPVAEPRLRYGGVHEFAVTTGVSRVSGPMWGYRQDVDYEVVNLRYSRLMKPGRHFTAYYSPELTPYARLDEPVLNEGGYGTVELARKHTTGGGVTPVGFTIDLLPTHRIQPFWRSNFGVLYFRDRVLSPEGSQFMFTVDMGVGLHVYQGRHFATSVGFRYIHMSNANISQHNPGTDAEAFYIGFSRFHSPKNRDGM